MLLDTSRIVICVKEEKIESVRIISKLLLEM